MSEADIKSLIIGSATKFFTKHGYHKTTMDEVARYAHKAKGLLYYYFKNKEVLFNEVLKKELLEIQQALTANLAGIDDPFDMIERYLLVRFKLLRNAHNYHETLRADFFERYHFVKDVRDEFSRFECEQIRQILYRGKELGYVDISDIEATVNLIVLLLTSIEVPLFLQDKYDAFEHSINELILFIINGLKSAKVKR